MDGTTCFLEENRTPTVVFHATESSCICSILKWIFWSTLPNWVHPTVWGGVLRLKPKLSVFVHLFVQMSFNSSACPLTGQPLTKLTSPLFWPEALREKNALKLQLAGTKAAEQVVLALAMLNFPQLGWRWGGSGKKHLNEKGMTQ